MILFDNPFLLYAAPAVAILIGFLALWARRARVRHAARWSDDLATLARRKGRAGWLALALATLVATVGMAGPRFGQRTVTAESAALDMVIAVDISRSMLAEDIAPSRLGRAQREATRLIHDLREDRIGLVAFAGQSFILSPLTSDENALQLLVDGLDPEIASVGGTALGRALRQGGEVLHGGDDVADRVLVVFTDGEGHDSLPEVLAAAERLRSIGVRLILVGEGKRHPVRIPVRGPDGQLVKYQTDPTGQPVFTSRRDEMLTAVADAAQAALVSADISDQAGAVRELVTAFKRTPQATTATTRGVSRAWIPALLAVLLLLGHTITRRTAALAGLGWLMLLPRGAAAQSPRNPADEAWRRREYRRAAELWVTEVRAGMGGDTAWLNAGTAGLAIRDTGLARSALDRAIRSLDPDIRFRALYNVGLLNLRLGLADSSRRDEHFAVARRVYREALLLRPGDAQAKWNLELAIQPTPPEPKGGGGSPPPKGSGGGGNEPPPPNDRGLSMAQAEQILNSIAEEERQTRRSLARRRSQSLESREDKDW